LLPTMTTGPEGTTGTEGVMGVDGRAEAEPEREAAGGTEDVPPTEIADGMPTGNVEPVNHTHANICPWAPRGPSQEEAVGGGTARVDGFTDADAYRTCSGLLGAEVYIHHLVSHGTWGEGVHRQTHSNGWILMIGTRQPFQTTTT
jgi:hypothetical protein